MTLGPLQMFCKILLCLLSGSEQNDEKNLWRSLQRLQSPFANSLCQKLNNFVQNYVVFFWPQAQSCGFICLFYLLLPILNLPFVNILLFLVAMEWRNFVLVFEETDKSLTWPAGSWDSASAMLSRGSRFESGISRIIVRMKDYLFSFQ